MTAMVNAMIMTMNSSRMAGVLGLIGAAASCLLDRPVGKRALIGQMGGLNLDSNNNG